MSKLLSKEAEALFIEISEKFSDDEIRDVDVGIASDIFALLYPEYAKKFLIDERNDDLHSAISLSQSIWAQIKDEKTQHLFIQDMKNFLENLSSISNLDAKAGAKKIISLRK